MRAWRALRRHGGEQGTTTLEFIWLVVGLMLPIVYLLVSLARLQAGLYAVNTAAREAARVYVISPTEVAPQRAAAAGAMGFEDHGFEGQGSVSLACEGECHSAGSSVVARSTLEVRLPMAPPGVPAAITVRASHREGVDRYSGRAQ